MSSDQIVYQNQDVIPLSYVRPSPSGGTVTGLTITVQVKDARTGAVLLASTTLPEKTAGSGIYSYDWTHNLPNGGACVAFYTVGGRTIPEYFLITYPSGGSAR